MAVDIEPLLLKLSELAPRFGRAREDLETMVSRGRAHDYKGVMQNARLVLEAVLRSIVTEELKQTPGKAMLDELVTKFRQQANAGIIPTNVLAHMGTVQAWGNLSAHDHSGSLEDSGVKVGQDEVVASLNSMVAILTWYADRRGLTPAQSAAVTRAPVATATPPASSKAPLVAGGVLALALAGGVGYFALSPKAATPPKVEAPSAAPVDPFAVLDAVYATRSEPPPPPACRRAADAAQLARSATDVQALSLIENPSPEAAYLLARATPDVTKQRTLVRVATACAGFAAADHLAARLAMDFGDEVKAVLQTSPPKEVFAAAQKEISARRLGEARALLERARVAAPKWLENRVMLGGVLLQLGERDAARAEAQGAIDADPDYAPAFLLRFSINYVEDKADDAHKDLCRAVKLGSEQAKKKLTELGIECR